MIPWHHAVIRGERNAGKQEMQKYAGRLSTEQLGKTNRKRIITIIIIIRPTPEIVVVIIIIILLLK